LSRENCAWELLRINTFKYLIIANFRYLLK
jgi:hypothetical protein